MSIQEIVCVHSFRLGKCTCVSICSPTFNPPVSQPLPIVSVNRLVIKIRICHQSQSRILIIEIGFILSWVSNKRMKPLTYKSILLQQLIITEGITASENRQNLLIITVPRATNLPEAVSDQLMVLVRHVTPVLVGTAIQKHSSCVSWPNRRLNNCYTFFSLPFQETCGLAFQCCCVKICREFFFRHNERLKYYRNIPINK